MMNVNIIETMVDSSSAMPHIDSVAIPPPRRRASRAFNRLTGGIGRASAIRSEHPGRPEHLHPGRALIGRDVTVHIAVP